MLPVSCAEKQRMLIVKVKNKQLSGFADKVATISCKLVCLPTCSQSTSLVTQAASNLSTQYWTCDLLELFMSPELKKGAAALKIECVP